MSDFMLAKFGLRFPAGRPLAAGLSGLCVGVGSSLRAALGGEYSHDTYLLSGLCC